MGKALNRLWMLAAALLAAAPAMAQDDRPDPSFLSASAGVFEAFHDDGRAAEFLLQYRSGQKWWIFKPHAGVMATSDGAFYGFGGLLVDIHFGRHLVVTPSAAVGLYHDGDGKDLGHPVEFRTGLEIAYRFDDRSRLGIGAYHMSNATIGDCNPGVEMVTVSYSLPIERIFGN